MNCSSDGRIERIMHFLPLYAVLMSFTHSKFEWSDFMIYSIALCMIEETYVHKVDTVYLCIILDAVVVKSTNNKFIFNTILMVQLICERYFNVPAPIPIPSPSRDATPPRMIT